MSTDRFPPAPSSRLTPAGGSRILRKGASTRLGIRTVGAGELTPPAERFDRAAERGYQAGYAEGRARAEVELAEVRQQIAALKAGASVEVANARQALARALAAADVNTGQMAEELLDGLAAAAMALAEAVIGRELQLSPFPLLDALHRGLAEAPKGPTLIRLNPADAAILSADGADPFLTLAPGRDVTLVPDSNVEPGGCVLEIGSATIDARVSSAVERVRRALLEEEGFGYDEEPAA